MNTFALCMIFSIFQFCCIHFMEAKTDGEKNLPNKTHREVEPFTTILLNDETFSIPAQLKPPMHKSNEVSNRKKENFNRIVKIDNHMKTNNGRQHNNFENTKIKPHHLGFSARNNIAHNPKLLSENHHDKVIKHLKNARSLQKKIHKRHFDNPIRYYNDKNNYLKRNDFGPTYRFVLTEATKVPKNNLVTSQTNAHLFTVKTSGENLSTSTRNEFFEDLNTNPWENAEHLTTRGYLTNVPSYVPLSSSSKPTWLDPSKGKQNNNIRSFTQNNRHFQDPWLNQDMAMNLNRNGDESPMRNNKAWLITTSPPLHYMTFHQADIIQRNLAAASRKEKNGKAGKNNPTGDEPEFDDTDINFDETCDQIENQTCCVQREVGDVLTLSLKIKSSKKPSSFQIRWMKVYHKFDSNKGKPLEIEAGKLPWNMVSGSEGRQMRLNPVTNSDIDPNCFVAQVFLISKKHGKVLFTLLKRLVYRIEIPIIDMGKLYAGEELTIHIENFLSLPERGNLLFQWNLETKPHEYESLPSNIKVSNSGRSVVLKELKKGRLGVLNCVIYSANRYAIAKRRFNILNIVENVKRRSTAMSFSDGSLSRSELLRQRRCRHIMRRSQEEAAERFKEGYKPKSRKKRYRQMKFIESQLSEKDCEPSRKKLYSRLVRSLMRDGTTEDPRLMPLEKLFELSENGDGTLDNIIPHEVHYVRPKVKLISGTLAERSVDHPVSANCSANVDCTENAVCIFSEKETNNTVRNGNCYCRPEFYRDGTTCRKIPSSNHREKRLKRNARNDFAVPQHLFYQNSREIVKSTPETLEEEEESQPSKILAFEEEESFLLTDCIDDKDCSMHANCVQPTNGHPYCKCRPGFRGNGIFCWEMMDYVPVEEQFLTGEEMDTIDQRVESELALDRMAIKTAAPQEVEEGI